MIDTNNKVALLKADNRVYRFSVNNWKGPTKRFKLCCLCPSLSLHFLQNQFLTLHMERHQTHLSQSPPQPGGFMHCLQRGARATHMAVHVQEVIHKPKGWKPGSCSFTKIQGWRPKCEKLGNFLLQISVIALPTNLLFFRDNRQLSLRWPLRHLFCCCSYLFHTLSW